MPQDQVFKAGDFPIHVTEVSGTTTYKGKGWTRLPYFSFVKIEVEFTNIKVNTDMSLVDGVVKAVYDPNWSNILNVNALINIAKDLVDVVADVVQQLLNALNAYTGTKQNQTKIKDLHAQIDTITTNLLASSYIATEQKNQLVQAAQNNKDCWQKLEQGVPCASKPANPTPTKSGPNASNYTPSDNEFDCCTTPLSENANLIAAVAQAQTEAQNCKMPEPARGCPDGTLENPFNDGNWKSILELLNQLKTAIKLKKPFTYKKSLTLDTGSQISIGQTCFDPIYFDFTAMTETAKTINTITYKIETTTSFGGASYTTLNFDGQLWIKIPQTASSKAKIDYLVKWLLCGGTTTSGDAVDTATKPPIFPVTGAQLHNIFGGTDQARCEEVAKLINKYSTEYGIDNAEKMSYFVGQIGAETLLNNLDEDSYTKNAILISPKTTTLRNHNGNKVLKYCSLFETYDAQNIQAIQYPLCNNDIVVPNGNYYESKDIFYATDSYMTNSNLTPKSMYYINNPNNHSFFDVVYACQLNNGSIASKDGSRFRGRGYIQITGLTNYQTKVQDKWDTVNGRGTKDFMCRTADCDKNLDAIANDLDFSMLISLTFWKAGNTSELAKEVNDNSIEAVTKAVNGARNGIENRILYTNKSYGIFKK